MTKKDSIKETGKELPDDQWKRFEAAVDAAVKGGPKHRNAASQPSGYLAKAKPRPKPKKV